MATAAAGVGGATAVVAVDKSVLALVGWSVLVAGSNFARLDGSLHPYNQILIILTYSLLDSLPYPSVVLLLSTFVLFFPACDLNLANSSFAFTNLQNVKSILHTHTHTQLTLTHLLMS